MQRLPPSWFEESGALKKHDYTRKALIAGSTHDLA